MRHILPTPGVLTCSPLLESAVKSANPTRDNLHKTEVWRPLPNSLPTEGNRLALGDVDHRAGNCTRFVKELQSKRETYGSPEVGSKHQRITRVRKGDYRMEQRTCVPEKRLDELCVGIDRPSRLNQ
jgi:hypothetical protein